MEYCVRLEWLGTLWHRFVRQGRPEWLCLPTLKSKPNELILECNSGTQTHPSRSHWFFPYLLISIWRGPDMLDSPEVDIIARTSLPLTSNDTPCTKHLFLLDGGTSRPLTCKWGKNSGRPDWKLGAPPSRWEWERALAALSCRWVWDMWSMRGFSGCCNCWICREFGIAMDAGRLQKNKSEMFKFMWTYHGEK
jgi:hypothetical protein